MALLPDADLDAVARVLVRKLYAEMHACANIDAPAVRAAVAATDAWIDANAASYNNALSPQAKALLSADQKTVLFCYVALRRAGLLAAA